MCSSSASVVGGSISSVFLALTNSEYLASSTELIPYSKHTNFSALSDWRSLPTSERRSGHVTYFFLTCLLTNTTEGGGCVASCQSMKPQNVKVHISGYFLSDTMHRVQFGFLEVPAIIHTSMFKWPRWYISRSSTSVS